MSFFARLRDKVGGSVSSDPKLPHFHLNHPRNGGGPEQVLISVERRLRRLYRFTKHDPLELLDRVDKERSLRQLIEDPSQLEIVQNRVTRLEERYGDREWLTFGDVLMLDGDAESFKSDVPERSDRWLTLFDPEYPQGGLGPVPVDSGVCVYSHEHGGLLAAIDDDDPENHARLFWFFGSNADVGGQDCVSMVDGLVKFQLHAHHGPQLQLGEDGQLAIDSGSLFVAKPWPKIATAIKRKEANLARSGRQAYAATVDLTA